MTLAYRAPCRNDSRRSKTSRTLLGCLFAAFLAHSAIGQVSANLDNSGLSSLRFNGQPLLFQGAFRVNRIILQEPSGHQSNASLTLTSASLNRATQEVTLTYPWGSVRIGYTTNRNSLNLAITTSNRSSSTIVGIFYQPLVLQFPAAVQEYDGSTPLIDSNIGDPTLIQMTYGSGALVLANDDVIDPLEVGFPWVFDKPENTVFPLLVNTNKNAQYPDRVPFINRPIAPGASDVYHLSLRFGPADSTPATLAPDVNQKYAAAYPKQLQWNDRRAVGTLFLASPAIGSPTNPRGWFNDPTIDVTTADGIANLRTQVLAWADGAIAILTSMNAQGMITWDIEGEQYPHPTSYIGDPRIFATLAPEMAGIADDYFQKFRDAGFRVGVCIRPQQLVVSPDGSTANQMELTDPTQLLLDKIAYARNRWGATLFYVDSNGDAAFPYDANIFKTVAAAYPDIVLLPEHSNTLYYAYTAPYAELRGGVTSTAPNIQAIYPGAFTFINTADGPITQDYSQLVMAVRQGDSLMYRTWWNDPANPQVKAIYGIGTPADATPPVVSMSNPANGATISGGITLAAAASDNVAVAGVQFKVDGIALGIEIAKAPYAIPFNTNNLTDGVHTISAVARDTSGNMGTSTVISVNVRNKLPLPAPLH